MIPQSSSSDLSFVPKDAGAGLAASSAWSEKLDQIASDLYHTGSMLLGEGDETVAVIEEVLSSVDLPASTDPQTAGHNARLDLGARGIALLARRKSEGPDLFAAPAETTDGSGPVSCIEDDDLSAVGVSATELDRLLSGQDRHSLRDWLEGLPVSLRAIFVLRAVGGLSSAEVAALLVENGGGLAKNWTPDLVRGNFRQALCSLASQLIHATVAR